MSPQAPPAGGEQHIRYEVVLLGQFSARYAEQRLAQFHEADAGTPDRLHYTATFEALLLHARTLLEFLSKEPRADTYSAESFSSTWDLTAAATRLDHLRVRLNKELAHLDLNRGPRDWRPIEVARELLDEYDAFLKVIDKQSTPEGDARLREASLTAREALDRAERLAAEHPVLVGEHNA